MWIKPLRGQWLIPNAKESKAYVLVSVHPHLSVSGDPGTSQAKFLGSNPLPVYRFQGYMSKEGKTNVQAYTHTHINDINKDTILPHYRHGIRDPGLGCRFGAWVSRRILQVSLLFTLPHTGAHPWRKGSMPGRKSEKKKKKSITLPTEQFPDCPNHHFPDWVLKCYTTKFLWLWGKK